MAKKLRVGVLFGGKSGEHEVSLRSGASILNAIDRSKYEVVPIGIAKSGQWLGAGDSKALLDGVTVPALAGKKSATSKKKIESTGLTLQASAATSTSALDVVFPVLHGTFGEDGTIQGMLELADVAYVGSGVLGSSVGMDKDAMKKMFAAAGLPIVKHVTLLRSEWKASPRKCAKLIEDKLKYPVFVKPANLGSSVGISKVRERKELAKAMDEAAQFDRKIVIEEGVSGNGKLRGKGKARELEIAVLGNDDPIASVVGEIVPDREFYDYESKYDSTSTSEPVIPANITKAQAKQLRQMAIDAFKSCDCSGLARVDFLLEAADPASKKEPKIYLNEVNTMPGFTSISMYPKLWEATGISYVELIDRLIALGVERHDERKATSFTK
ncbi:D-alanine--D-alanine ligase family protein [Terriglobus sp. TAA 43]|uniref:D-alanine--D-alanine ligase family protein n=1 Tax=Terriglobus sp. TAA 43 TaxID=278961 RepID=UPI000647B210|nr:D-alanine--D-alanine ligase family protein [Terriglobus sp. TAA 43]